jgi:four helix bundle protein
LHCLNLAQASLSEIDTQVEISWRLSYFGEEAHEEIESKLVEVEKLLGGLERSLR